jgi:hypothetical protein
VLQDVTTGDTLCDEKKPIILERMEFPDPVIKVLGLATSIATTLKLSEHCVTKILTCARNATSSVFEIGIAADMRTPLLNL